MVAMRRQEPGGGLEQSRRLPLLILTFAHGNASRQKDEYEPPWHYEPKVRRLQRGAIPGQWDENSRVTWVFNSCLRAIGVQETGLRRSPRLKLQPPGVCIAYLYEKTDASILLLCFDNPVSEQPWRIAP